MSTKKSVRRDFRWDDLETIMYNDRVWCCFEDSLQNGIDGEHCLITQPYLTSLSFNFVAKLKRTHPRGLKSRKLIVN